MNKLNREVYKIVGYYIKCKQANLNNVDFLEKLKNLSEKYDKSISSLLALFIYVKNDIIQEAIKAGVYFDEKILDIPNDFKGLNRKNIHNK